MTWEVAEKTNYGVELEFLKTLLFQFDYFTEHRKKIYESRPVFPQTAGLTTSISSNTGKVSSKWRRHRDRLQSRFSNGIYVLQDVEHLLMQQMKLLLKTSPNTHTLI